MIRICIGIGSGIFIFLVSLFFSSQFISDPIFATSAAIIVAALPYFLWIFPNCTCIVPADKAWVIANTLQDEDSKIQTTFSGYRSIIAQRELQAGFHWKYPWENPDKEIDMSKHIVVENDMDKTYTLANKTIILIKWRIFCVPLPGRIVHYIKTKPEDIERRVKDRANSFLQGYVIDDEEEKLGIWTGTPEIIDIDQTKEVQDAQSFKQAMETKIAIAHDMVEASKDKIKFEQAMKLVLIGDGKAKIDFIELASVFPTGNNSQKQNKKGSNTTP